MQDAAWSLAVDQNFEVNIMIPSDLVIQSALIAQLVERVTSNDEVAGSTPS